MTSVNVVCHVELVSCSATETFCFRLTEVDISKKHNLENIIIVIDI